MRRHMAALSVFRGGWTLPAAHAVCELPDPAAAMTFLRERSLILVEERDGEMRYRMLEPIREYAAELLPRSERVLVAQHHARWLLQIADALEEKPRGDKQMESFARVEKERANLHAVFTDADVDPETITRLAGALGDYWLLCGHWREGHRLLRTALERADGASASARARAQLAAASLEWALDNYAEAERLGEAARSSFEELNDARGLAAALALLGTVALRRGDPPGAIALLEGSVAAYRGVEDAWGAANALDRLACALRDAGDYTRAESLYRECLATRRELQDRQGTAITLSNLGDVALLRGESARAAAMHEECLCRFRSLNNAPGTAYSLCRLAAVAQGQGDLERALTLCMESITLTHQIGDRRRLAGCFETLACIQLDRGHAGATETAETAAVLFGAAEGLRELLGAPLPPQERAELELSRSRGEAVLGQDAFDRALTRGTVMDLDDVVHLALGDPASTATE
jgi:tetratricopeptide (TPR) repeat protein